MAACKAQVIATTQTASKEIYDRCAAVIAEKETKTSQTL
jgi:hypothetical protein